ncbi:hypothetical protein [Tissierella sp.]|uniref:hypothetical protein n=1 Tax=Tissierella sp. TaxID=41274 RepID=UPI0028AF1DE9|nr:hypothetical protein [Tissierella sp.]
MFIDEFLHIMKKVKRFQERLSEEGISGQQVEVILKVYIQDLTDRINTNFLKKVV